MFFDIPNMVGIKIWLFSLNLQSSGLFLTCVIGSWNENQAVKGAGKVTQ